MSESMSMSHLINQICILHPCACQCLHQDTPRGSPMVSRSMQTKNPPIPQGSWTTMRPASGVSLKVPSVCQTGKRSAGRYWEEPFARTFACGHAGAIATSWDVAKPSSMTAGLLTAWDFSQFETNGFKFHEVLWCFHQQGLRWWWLWDQLASLVAHVANTKNAAASLTTSLAMKNNSRKGRVSIFNDVWVRFDQSFYFFIFFCFNSSTFFNSSSELQWPGPSLACSRPAGTGPRDPKWREICAKSSGLSPSKPLITSLGCHGQVPWGGAPLRSWSKLKNSTELVTKWILNALGFRKSWSKTWSC